MIKQPTLTVFPRVDNHVWDWTIEGKSKGYWILQAAPQAMLFDKVAIAILTSFFKKRNSIHMFYVIPNRAISPPRHNRRMSFNSKAGQQ